MSSGTWNGLFRHGFRKNFSTTITRWVGPTDRTGVREPLPEASPNDSNTTWLAKNGSDANPGTQAFPVLTLAHAILLAGINTTPNIQIFRNGYVGDLTFTLPSNSSTFYPHFIQVEEGEFALIKSDIVGTQRSLEFLNSLSAINGLYFQDMKVILSGAGGTIANCMADYRTRSWFEVGGDGNSMLSSIGTILWNTLSAGVTLIYYNNIGVALSPGLGVQIAPIHIFNDSDFSSPANVIVNARRSIIYNPNTIVGYSDFFSAFVAGKPATQTVISAIKIDDDVPAGVNNRIYLMNFDSCWINSPALAFFISGYDYPTADIQSLALNINFSVNGCVNSVIQAFGPGGPTQLVGVINNAPISPNTPAMFMDFAGSYADPMKDQAYGFSLQAHGKATLNGAGQFFFDSPLKNQPNTNIGTGDVDPFIETTSLVSQTFTKETLIHWPPALYKPTIRFVNAETLEDLRGNPHSGFDGIRLKIDFSFGDGTNYANNNDLRRLVRLLADTGPMQFFPKTEDNGLTILNLFTDPSTGVTLTTQGLFDSSNDTFTPVSMTDPLIEFNWRGKWITIEDKDYYISANDEFSFTLVDKYNAGFPSDGLHYFKIEYILVKTILADLAAQQEFFSYFLDGGAFRESGYNESQAFEMKNYSAGFTECEDLEME